MCRVLVRKQDNHQFLRGGTSEKLKLQLHQGGDVIQVLEDGVSAGLQGEQMFHILEFPGVLAADWKAAHPELCDEVLDGRGVLEKRSAQRIDLLALRSRMTAGERSKYDGNQPVRMSEAELKLTQSKTGRRGTI